jgi:hypothetical protein
MEVFRQMPDGRSGGSVANLAVRVRAESPPLDHWRKFVYCSSMTGDILGEVDHFKVLQQFILPKIFGLTEAPGSSQSPIGSKSLMALSTQNIVLRKGCQRWHNLFSSSISGKGKNTCSAPAYMTRESL